MSKVKNPYNAHPIHFKEITKEVFDEVVIANSNLYCLSEITLTDNTKGFFSLVYRRVFKQVNDRFFMADAPHLLI